MFDIGASARRAVMEININYLTDLYVFDCMRYAILENIYAMDRKIRGKFELDEAYFKDNHKRNHGHRTKKTKSWFLAFWREEDQS